MSRNPRSRRGRRLCFTMATWCSAVDGSRTQGPSARMRLPSLFLLGIWHYRSMLARRNVLIFHLGALGDFLLTWPIALALGRLHPQSRIFYVTHAGKGRLAEQVLRIEAADIENGWHALFSDGAALPPASEKLLASAHTVVSFLSNGQDTWAANVKRISPDVNLIALNGPTLESPPIAEHATQCILRQLRPWPALANAVEQILRSIAERGVGGGMIAPKEMIVIHPGSGAARKCWPIERFVEL